MNCFNLSFFICSSEVGFPAAFCCWSNIIFSTVCLVSPSKSDNLEFSGSTFYVLISISPSIRQFHQFYFSYFSMVICKVDLDPSRSMFQKLSSAWIFLHHFPSINGSLGFDLRQILNLVMVILTSSILAVVFSGSLTYDWTSSKVWCQVYFSVNPPLPALGAYFNSSSASFLACSGSYFSPSSSLSVLTTVVPASFAALASAYLFFNFSSSSICFASSSSISSTVAPPSP